MKTYLYQLAVRYPNDKEKRIVMESDTVTHDTKFTQKEVDEMAKKLNTDVRLEFIGTLTSSKSEKAKVIIANVITKEQWEEKHKQWEDQAHAEITK